MQWVADTRKPPGDDVSQPEFLIVAESDVPEIRRQIREHFRAALLKAGGYEWLAKAMRRGEHYHTKIRDAANGVDNYKVHLDWLASVLVDPAGAKVFLEGLCSVLGYEMPQRRQPPEPNNVVGPMIDEFDRMGEPGKTAIAKLAAQRGVTVETLRRACGR